MSVDVECFAVIVQHVAVGAQLQVSEPVDVHDLGDECVFVENRDGFGQPNKVGYGHRLAKIGDRHARREDRRHRREYVATVEGVGDRVPVETRFGQRDGASGAPELVGRPR